MGSNLEVDGLHDFDSTDLEVISKKNEEDLKRKKNFAGNQKNTINNFYSTLFFNEDSDFNFILKPIDPKDLISTVNILEKNLKNELFTTNTQLQSTKTSIKSKTSDYNFIAIPSTKKIDFIKIDDILYFESDGRYTIIYLTDKTTFFVSKNIGGYDKILTPRYFFRTHKKYLINLKYIININNADGSNCELMGNLTLPVAKRRKEDLVSFLNIR